MRTFVFTDATSNKFWHIELAGNTFTVTFGRVGTTGQTQTKSFTSPVAARKEHDKLVAQKLKKGYVETTAPAAAASAPVASTEQKALEAALVAHPDEVAAHSAYADYLTEAGDPRGELIQVQLALEDPARPKAERTTLLKRESALLKKHAREWMGDVGRFLVGAWSGEDKPYHYRFARGWLDFVRTLPFPEGVSEALASAPEARLLRHLEVVYDMRHHPFDFDRFVEKLNEVLTEDEQIDTGEFYMSDPFSILPVLIKSTPLGNLRVLKYGFSDDHKGGPSHSTMVDPFGGTTAEQFLDFLKKCPRLEELYLNTTLRNIGTLFGSPLLGNLRVLQYYYGMQGGARNIPRVPYPLSALAKNKALSNLTTLRLHPGREAEIVLDELDALVRSKNLPALAHLQIHMTTYGDDGAERIVSSGILKRLKTLDIGYGNMTDEGARVLAACPDLKNLDVLDASQNGLTQAGIRALSATGVHVVAEEQHDTEENDYMYSVDWE
jgi:uncharacterized protein (TIGR02996 family)